MIAKEITIYARLFEVSPNEYQNAHLFYVAHKNSSKLTGQQQWPLWSKGSFGDWRQEGSGNHSNLTEQLGNFWQLIGFWTLLRYQVISRYLDFKNLIKIFSYHMTYFLI